MINILLVEDHNLVREGLKMLLENDKELKVKATVKTALDALKYLEVERCDVILADSNMPDMEGVDFLNKVKKRFPEIKVVILTDQNDNFYITEAFKNKADGYLLKDGNAKELSFALKFVADNSKYVSADLAMRHIETLIQNNITSSTEMSQVSFSSREIEILQLIAEGYTNLEISEKLFLSKRTIEGHRQMLIDKSGSKNSAALVRLGMISGIIK